MDCSTGDLRWCHQNTAYSAGRCLQRLDLSDNPMTGDVAEALAAMLQQQPHLRALNLNDTSLEDAGISTIAQALSSSGDCNNFIDHMLKGLLMCIYPCKQSLASCDAADRLQDSHELLILQLHRPFPPLMLPDRLFSCLHLDVLPLAPRRTLCTPHCKWHCLDLQQTPLSCPSQPLDVHVSVSLLVAFIVCR